MTEDRKRFAVIIQAVVETTRPDAIYEEAQKWAEGALWPSEVTRVTVEREVTPVEVDW